MSRCFPFPPPGYERKLDDTDLLKKETRKQKKHKKDKNDREKTDSKEKKEEKKQKETNEKKDKHKEKKKGKEKRVDQVSECQNQDPLRQNNEHNEQKDGSLGHEKSSVQPRNRGHRELLIGKEEHVQSWGQNEKLLVNRIKTEDIYNSKFVQELGRRIREEDKRTGSLEFPVDSRKSNVDRGEFQKIDGQGITSNSTFNRMSMVQTTMTVDYRKTHERVKEKTEHTKAAGNKNKYVKNGEIIASFNNLSTYNTANVGIQHSGSELKKRKDLEINDFSHENEPRPNKTARPTSSILTEKGTKQDFLQNLGLSQPRKSTKVDTKEQTVNGSMASQLMSPISEKPPLSTANQILVKPTATNNPLPVSSTKPLLNSKRKESIRPPHPDTKYLKQILAVPELDRWSGLDNQEWLFSSKDYTHFREKAGSFFLLDNKGVEVWSEARQLESVDVCALPYVIPY